MLLARLFDDPQRRPVVAGGHAVEVVERPVELGEPWPGEVAIGGGVVGAVREQEVAGFQEGVGIGHGCFPSTFDGEDAAGT